jgi:hypothetical protein
MLLEKLEGRPTTRNYVLRLARVPFRHFRTITYRQESQRVLLKSHEHPKVYPTVAGFTSRLPLLASANLPRWEGAAAFDQSDRAGAAFRIAEEWYKRELRTMERMAAAPTRRTANQREDLYHFIITMVESCMRVEELRQLTAGQVTFREKYALVDVRGKRGHRQAVVGGLAFDVLKFRSDGLKAR